MSLPTRNRRFVVRQYRTVITLASAFALSVLTFIYFSQRQPDTFLPQSWNYDVTQQWDWRKFADGWNVPISFDDPVRDPFELETEEEVEAVPHVWDMKCHEAVEKGLKVAVYDWTPFHEGE
jgi:hypothetical protein